MVRTVANLVTAARLAATIPTVWLILLGHWLLAGAFFLFAVASDFADGHIARVRSEASVFGGTLDHTCDALYVSAVLGALARVDLIPLVLPPLVLFAFLQYLLDSNALAGAPLRASTLGRANGVLYFINAGLAMLGGWTQIEWLSQLMYWAAWVLVATTLVSMADRAIAFYRIRKSR